NATKPEVEFRVKTLEEIRFEKASRRKGDIWPKLKVTVSCTANDSSPGAKPSPAIRIKTFSEVLDEKKQTQMEEERIQTEKERLSKSKHDSEPQKQGSIVSAPAKRKLEEPFGKAKDLGEVRIKTLEEIKKEKALRMQQTLDSTVKTQLQAERAPAERRLFCMTKPTAPGNEEEPHMELTSSSRDGTADATVKQQKRKSQEEQVVVASAREEMGEAKALVTTNPASP
ncbi:zinc finger CCCH domain-containing protein 11A-like, partial [Sceloporus undulatus]|uniref:zinc finger CCCH domain-containing protein 11A-like n=1 Tax=Sceloporus undulatus TaxID=8520 RepID=UPI001C4AFA21